MNSHPIAVSLCRLPLPLYSGRVPAGFPSPADDHLERRLDLNEHLIHHPSATFFCRVSGDSMQGLGIFDGDLLVVDRALRPVHGDVVLALVEGGLTCKVLDCYRQRLCSANERYPPIDITEHSDLVIEGVVAHSIRSHRCTP